MSRAKAREPGDGLPSHLAIRELRYRMRIRRLGVSRCAGSRFLEVERFNAESGQIPSGVLKRGAGSRTQGLGSRKGGAK
jgi:hypothetical protein